MRRVDVADPIPLVLLSAAPTKAGTSQNYGGTTTSYEEEMTNGTFSISNLGMYGIKQFDAVINPPQGAILAVGAGEPRPVVKDGALSVATVMSCTLSCDHRVVDGAIGAEFLSAFKAMIEEPLGMLL